MAEKVKVLKRSKSQFPSSFNIGVRGSTLGEVRAAHRTDCCSDHIVTISKQIQDVNSTLLIMLIIILHCYMHHWRIQGECTHLLFKCHKIFPQPLISTVAIQTLSAAENPVLPDYGTVQPAPVYQITPASRVLACTITKPT